MIVITYQNSRKVSQERRGLRPLVVLSTLWSYRPSALCATPADSFVLILAPASWGENAQKLDMGETKILDYTFKQLTQEILRDAIIGAVFSNKALELSRDICNQMLRYSG